MKRLFAIVLLMSCLAAGAQNPGLRGFSYETVSAPDGTEWESPERLALNKEQPRTWFFCFDGTESARRILPEYSEYYMTLDGKWRFNWAGNPDERPAGFYRTDFDVSGWDKVTVPMQWNVAGIRRDGSLAYGVPIYVNQPVIFHHKVAVDDWRGGVMRTPAEDWTTYRYRNEVGSYRRTFDVPSSWKGREVYINFDGVSSFFYLWINGRYIGFSKNSRNTASFDITPYLDMDGENTVAVEVYRNSDGSFLEAQDMFRLPGIFRTVSLTSTDRAQVRDFRVFPRLDEDNGTIRVETDVRNLTSRTLRGYSLSFSLYANELYSDENVLVDEEFESVPVGEVGKGCTVPATASLTVKNPRHWTAETPYRYTLVGQLKDRRGRVVETFSTALGFRNVEIRDVPAEQDEFGMAGRYFLINGKPVKLKGVNRQEINPETGNVVTRGQLEKEIMLMKRGNINHVRNSHYSNTPYWYYLCDKYGIYLEDESNIESHEYYYGEASLSHVPEFEAAHVARVMELAHAHVNHPSIVIWSLGNEAGPGKNFVSAYSALHDFDPSRPVQYERNNDIVDMGSNQYPSIEWVRRAATGTLDIKYPFHISEYAHSMGNAVGNLVDYWDAIESSDFICGAAVWDWVDQALFNYDSSTGERYLAYGGDFGDRPNSGMFCMNGILLPGHEPKPAYFEVRKVYQNVGVKAVDMERGIVEAFNKNYFVSLGDYRAVWSLYEDGVKVEETELDDFPDVEPRKSVRCRIPYDRTKLKEGSEYFVKIQFLLARDMPWAEAGTVQMEEQLKVKEAGCRPTLAELNDGPGMSSFREEGPFVRIEGEGFSVVFNNGSGTIGSLEYDGRPVLCHGPEINAFRAPVDNDNWARDDWFANGLHNMRHMVVSHSVSMEGGVVKLRYTVESQAPCRARLEGGESGRNTIVELTDEPCGYVITSEAEWTVYPDGSIELQSDITSNNPELVVARLGYGMQVSPNLSDYTYYGRGPWNNYNDRRTGAFVELYRSTVADQFIPFPKPQSMGNREEVRWCALTDGGGNGVEFIASDVMSASALPWSDVEMTLAPHPYQLPKPGNTHLHLDVAVTGLGGNSCGQGGPLSHDRVTVDGRRMHFVIRPVRGGSFTEIAEVSLQ